MNSIKPNNIDNLTRDELLEEYSELLGKYQELRSVKDENAQRIHELKRALDTAEAAQAYLSQELEHVSKHNANTVDDDIIEQRMKTEEWCKKSQRLQEELNILNSEYDQSQQEVLKLRELLENAQKETANAGLEHAQRVSDENVAKIQEIEMENVTLIHKLEESNDVITQKTLFIAEQQKNLEILRDEVNCLKENLRSKREEIEEKTQLLESTQEKLAEANGLVAMMSSAPDQRADRKGNSLFAEVDDQRQAMKQVLIVQKKNYLEMKKFYTESEYEIRRLKRENKSFHTELDACISIFCNADKIYQNKLNERICRLMKENESLEQKLNWTQERLKTIAKENNANWLNSLLDFCNNETANYKQQLHSVRIQNATLEEGLRKAQQEMVRWRFESLKSRVVISNYEQLLKEHKIPFKPVQLFEYKISENDQKAAKPCILSCNNMDDMAPSKQAMKDEYNGQGNDTTSDVKTSKTIPFKTLQSELNGGEQKAAKPPGILSCNNVDDMAPSKQTVKDVSTRECNSQGNDATLDAKTSKTIPFKSLQSELRDGEHKADKPCILSSNNVDDMDPSKQEKKVVSTAETNDQEDDATSEVISADTVEKESILSSKIQKSEISSSDIENACNEKENSPECNQLEEDSFQMSDRFAKLKVKKCSPMRPSQKAALLTKKGDLKTQQGQKASSILRKEVDLFSEQMAKKVSFSSAGNVVHKFVPEMKSIENLVVPTIKSNAIVIKDASGNSNIVVKRMVIHKAKHK